jgi:hypothetical protein
MVLIGRKKNGKTPTGILAHAAKASGCSSVHDLLNKGAAEVAAVQQLVSPPKANYISKVLVLKSIVVASNYSFWLISFP